MKILNLLESSSLVLYRGVTKNKLPNRYPGSYYTLDQKLAQRYAKDGGTVYKVNKQFNKILDLRKLNDPPFYEMFLSKWQEFVKNNNFNPSETQFYDIFQNGIRDFSYPTVEDTSFLKYMGYDAVYFHEEGGEVVRSIFIPD